MFDFNTMDMQVIPHFKGGEGHINAKMYADDSIRIMRSVLEKGCSIGLHTHETSSETIYVLAGRAKAVLDGAEELLGPGQCHYCPKGHTHEFINIGDEDLEFFAVVPEQ